VGLIGEIVDDRFRSVFLSSQMPVYRDELG
jgi:hypothetical protein